MGYVTFRFVGTTNSAFTNNEIYSVFGWACNASTEPVAILFGDNNEFQSVSIKDSSDWNPETVIDIDAKVLL